MKMNAGVWIGIIAGIFGFVVAIGSVLATAGPEGIYIAGGILAFAAGMGFLFYKLLIGPMMLNSRLQKTGIPAKAIIKEVRDTGVTINNNPQVKLVQELKNSLGQRYSSTVRVLVSRLQPYVYQPGMTVGVLVDPKDENKMVIDTNSSSRQNKTNNTRSSGLTSMQEILLREELQKDEQQADTIRLSGLPARAIVKSCTFLGIHINGNDPYTRIEIEVLPTDAPSFSATVKGVIKEEAVAKYQPGVEIFVKYDAVDKKKVAIVYD